MTIEKISIEKSFDAMISKIDDKAPPSDKQKIAAAIHCLVKAAEILEEVGDSSRSEELTGLIERISNV